MVWAPFGEREFYIKSSDKLEAICVSERDIWINNYNKNKKWDFVQQQQIQKKEKKSQNVFFSGAHLVWNLFCGQLLKKEEDAKDRPVERACVQLIECLIENVLKLECCSGKFSEDLNG